MKLLILHVFSFMLATGLNANSPNISGKTTVNINVSVTVMESAHVNQANSLFTNINSTGVQKLNADSQGIGMIRIPSYPFSEVLIGVSGSTEITNGTGRSITITPEISVGRDVVQEHELILNGKKMPVIYTESRNGGYRGIAEIKLFGTLDAGDQESGRFSTMYTVSVEYQ